MKKMKKKLLFGLMLVSSTGLFAQSLQFVDLNGNDISQTTQTQYYVNAPVNEGLSYPVTCNDVGTYTNDLDVKYHFGIKNISGSTMDVKVKRYELNYGAGSYNYFCWYLCYSAIPSGLAYEWPTPPNPAANDYRTVDPNVIDTNFYAYYQPKGSCVQGLFRYVAFDANNPNDSTWIDVEFDFPVGIEENNVEASAYPNPASSVLNINIDADSYNGLQLTMINVLGEKIAEQTITSNTIQLNVDACTPGIYFYSISDKNGILTTKKIRIER